MVAAAANAQHPRVVGGAVQASGSCSSMPAGASTVCACTGCGGLASLTPLLCCGLMWMSLQTCLSHQAASSFGTSFRLLWSGHDSSATRLPDVCPVLEMLQWKAQCLSRLSAEPFSTVLSL